MWGWTQGVTLGRRNNRRSDLSFSCGILLYRSYSALLGVSGLVEQWMNRRSYAAPRFLAGPLHDALNWSGKCSSEMTSRPGIGNRCAALIHWRLLLLEQNKTDRKRRKKAPFTTNGSTHLTINWSKPFIWWYPRGCDFFAPVPIQTVKIDRMELQYKNSVKPSKKEPFFYKSSNLTINRMFSLMKKSHGGAIF